MKGNLIVPNLCDFVCAPFPTLFLYWYIYNSVEWKKNISSVYNKNKKTKKT